jgi:hypothetical protein
MYQLHLPDQDRALLAQLPSELIQLLEGEGDDKSIFRLFPPGYTNDIGLQVEYDRLMRDQLMDHHVKALRVLTETADARELTEEQLDLWMKALNQFRLVLGTRLDVTEEMDFDDIDADDPRASAFALYAYLGYLQEEVIDVMSEGLG